MGKFELVFYKINTYFQKTTTCIGLQAEQLFSVNIWYKYFFNFGHGFYCSFFIVFPKAPHSCVKKSEIIFAALCLYLYELKNCFRFFTSNFKLEIWIFLSFVVSFLVEIKLLFWQKKHQWWNLRHTLVEKLSKIIVATYWRKIPSLAEVGSLQSCLTVETVENVRYF